MISADLEASDGVCIAEPTGTRRLLSSGTLEVSSQKCLTTTI